MSVLDQLRAIEQQVEKRLRELAPLVAEYRDLEKVAERLGLKRDAPEPTEPPAAKPAAKVKRRPKPARTSTRTTPGTKSRALHKKAEATATKPARTAPTDTAPTSRTSQVAASKRAKPKPKPKSTAVTRGASSDEKTTARARRTAAAPGQRQQDVLRLVSERPGITVAELAHELGVDATGLYGVVRRLQEKGQISKHGTALRPTTEPPSSEQTPATATTPAETTPTASSTTAESPAPPSEPPATDSQPDQHEAS